MHELSVARAVIAEVTDSACAHGVEAVGEVTLRVGRLSGIVAESLQFGFELSSPGTICEGAKLVVEIDPVVVWCPDGEHEVELDDMVFACPTHGCPTPEVRSGDDLLIKGYRPAVAPPLDEAVEAAHG